MKREDFEFVVNLKQNMLCFDEKLHISLKDYITNNISVKKVKILYALAKLFGLSKFAKEIVSFMRQSFTISVRDNWLEYPDTKQVRTHPVAAFFEDSVYVFGGGNRQRHVITEVQKYSFASDEWSVVASSPDDRRQFCVCAFKARMCVIGGSFEDHDEHHYTITASCLEFDGGDWKELAGMRGPRADAACAVFKGEVVVCGGEGVAGETLRSVEAWDGRRWRPMPEMNVAKEAHCAFVLKNKFFVVGDGNQLCEVLDDESKKFAMLKSPKVPELDAYFIRSASIGNKFVVTGKDSTKAFCYDVTTDVWSEMVFEFAENMFVCRNILSSIFLYKTH